MTDATGSRAFSYNEYDELVSDCLTADEIPHLITENRDGFGRSTGFAYSKAGSPASAEQYGYACLPGTHLLQRKSLYEQRYSAVLWD